MDRRSALLASERTGFVARKRTARRENPNHGMALPRNRAHGAVSQNRSRSIKWAPERRIFRHGVVYSPEINLAAAFANGAVSARTGCRDSRVRGRLDEVSTGGTALTR